jgi:hypothetical protein
MPAIISSAPAKVILLHIEQSVAEQLTRRAFVHTMVAMVMPLVI